jgi:signal transduction histidine kinase
MFEKARLKLTIWYLLIIMIISIFFSIAIYSDINTEFKKIEKKQELFQKRLNRGFLSPPPTMNETIKVNSEAIQEARIRVLTTLSLINLLILFIAGAAGHFLAGRTLKPIKEMLNEQNRFITDASHELRTPLTSLRTGIEVNLRNKKMKIEDYKNLLQSNLEEVISLQTLSDNLLKLSLKSRIINQQDLKTASLKKMIGDAVKKVVLQAKNKQIKIYTQATDVQIKVMPDRITEAITIFLDNAIKYSPPKSQIDITSYSNPKNTKISIADRGIGIGEDDLPFIFDRFFRADRSRAKDKSEIQGYGLGLSIARRIINSHQGSIEVKSRLNKGTTIIITLPS